jgi:hypothetical protein
MEISPKSLKWTDITNTEMKKILGLTLLMGQVRKDNVKHYWSTDPTIVTRISHLETLLCLCVLKWQVTSWCINYSTEMYVETPCL